MKTSPRITRRHAMQLLAAGTALGATGLAWRSAATPALKGTPMINFLNRNGIKLAYSETGSGPKSVLLIHGWADTHELLSNMAEHFSRNARVISVDLRGHGSSDKPKTGYAIPEFADDLAWMCEQLNLKNPLIVGHSLGGAISLEMAARRPQLPKAIVMLEGVILMPKALREASKPLGDALRSPAWMDVMRGFVESNFLPTDDPALKRRNLASLENMPQHVHVGVFEGANAWDAASAAKACKVPALYVDASGSLSDLEQFKQLCPQLLTGKTVGVGHNQMVATPQQANAMIDRFLAINK
jgi:pimeloyl-ACP methyl ester carboxylesterase